MLVVVPPLSLAGEWLFEKLTAQAKTPFRAFLKALAFVLLVLAWLIAMLAFAAARA